MITRYPVGAEVLVMGTGLIINGKVGKVIGYSVNMMGDIVASIRLPSVGDMWVRGKNLHPIAYGTEVEFRSPKVKFKSYGNTR